MKLLTRPLTIVKIINAEKRDGGIKFCEGGFAPAQQSAPAQQQKAQPAPAMVDDGFDDDTPF